MTLDQSPTPANDDTPDTPVENAPDAAGVTTDARTDDYPEPWLAS
jgi:hypothetical protein